MKFFLSQAERKNAGSTCYHEFYQGKWDESKMDFWNDESMNLHDDWMILLGLDTVILSIVDDYNPYGETEINEQQWKMIVQKAGEAGGHLLEAIQEITPWMENNFRKNEVFTLLGL